jgi:hypothetical protein
MSMSEREHVLETHKKLAESGHPVHVSIQTALEPLQQYQQLQKRRQRAWRPTTASADAKAFIFDYNTLEATLLASSVLVCLAGIMFESGYLSSGASNADTARNLVAGMTLTIIILSILYFLALFGAELLASAGACSQRLQMLKRVQSRLTLFTSSSGATRAVSPRSSEGRSRALVDELQYASRVGELPRFKSSKHGANPMFVSASGKPKNAMGRTQEQSVLLKAVNEVQAASSGPEMIRTSSQKLLRRLSFAASLSPVHSSKQVHRRASAIAQLSSSSVMSASAIVPSTDVSPRNESGGAAHPGTDNIYELSADVPSFTEAEPNASSRDTSHSAISVKSA